MHYKAIEETVWQTVSRHNMLSKGDCVLVALSGGADSVALFHLLLSYQSDLSLSVLAAHVNHGLRGEESNEEEAFVRSLCERHRVPVFVKHLHMAEEYPEKNGGGEARARSLRHAFLQELACAHSAKIATGHTASDNAETVLFHAVRGSFTGGLSGIHPKRGRYIRPLLALSRGEVRRFCKERQYFYKDDSSNENTAYSRNFLRLNVLPGLESVHTGAERNLHRLAEDMRELHAYLTEEALLLLKKAREMARQCETVPGWFVPGFDAETLRSAPLPIRKQAFALLAGREGGREHLQGMEAVLQNEKTGAQLMGGLFVRIQHTRFLMVCKAGASNFLQEQPLQSGSIHFENGYTMMVSVKTAQAFCEDLEGFKKKDYKLFADYDKINQSCIFRTRRRGDVFCQSGRSVCKSMKKWMQDVGIDKEKREQIPLLYDKESERIAWVYGAGFAEGFSVEPGTKRVLCIETEYEECAAVLPMQEKKGE